MNQPENKREKFIIKLKQKKPEDTETPEQKIERFHKMPKYKQGTKEWLDQRMNYLTASTIYSALGKAGKSARKHLLIEKGSYGKQSFFSGNLATQHGNKCEPIANAVYSKINNVTVQEFGMITNDKYPILGVSPDGILLDRMLEIKCPYSRKINGVIKPEYYHQIQEQLSVCEYDVCDFLECKIDFIQEERFYADFSVFEDSNIEKGCIIHYLNTDDCKLSYLYSPLSLTETELKKWTTDICTSDILALSVSYWIMSKYNCQSVNRDPKWIITSYPILQSFWDEVMNIRENITNLDDYLLSDSDSDNESINDVQTSILSINMSGVCLI